ncbi:ribonuclease D [Ursidibacter arcticus]
MNQQIEFNWIQTNQELQTACLSIQQQSLLALDTEFVRTRTYYPQLGLIQLYDGKQVYLIDPLNITDFSPFIGLLSNQNILKILHACGEDLDIFQHYFKQMPEPMIDTQVMSAFIGLGSSIGFSKLVANYCQVELDKSTSRTDWLKRPLSEKQLQYAVSDVWYLLPVYQHIKTLLAQTEWESAVNEECLTLKQKRQIELNIEKAYKKIANAWQLNSTELTILKLLEKWRIEEAQKRDIALNFIVKEQALWQIAKNQPKHTAQLLEFMHPNEVRRYGKKLLLLVEQGKNIPKSEQVSEIKRLIDEPNYKRDLTFLKKSLENTKPQNLSVELFASKRQLDQLFKWHIKGQCELHLPELLRGWREPFGKKLWESYRLFLSDTSEK